MRTLLYRNLEPEFTSPSLSGADGPVSGAERFRPLIEEVQKQPQQTLERTIDWSTDPAEAETFHAIPLTGRHKELLGVLLVGSSRRQLVTLTRHIQRIAAAVAGADRDPGASPAATGARQG